MKITTHNNLVKVAADWKDWAVPVGSGLLAYLAGRGLGLGQVGSIMLGAAGATGGHFARKNWDKWFPGRTPAPTPASKPSTIPTFQRAYRDVPGMNLVAEVERKADENRLKEYNELRDSILQTQENEQPPISQEEAEAEANAMRQSEINSMAPTNPSPFEKAEAERRANEVKTPIFQRVYRNVPGMTVAEDLKRAGAKNAQLYIDRERETLKRRLASLDQSTRLPKEISKQYLQAIYERKDPLANPEIVNYLKFNTVGKPSIDQVREWNEILLGDEYNDPQVQAALGAIGMSPLGYRKQAQSWLNRSDVQFLINAWANTHNPKKDRDRAYARLKQLAGRNAFYTTGGLDALIQPKVDSYQKAQQAALKRLAQAQESRAARERQTLKLAAARDALYMLMNSKTNADRNRILYNIQQVDDPESFLKIVGQDKELLKDRDIRRLWQKYNGQK